MRHIPAYGYSSIETAHLCTILEQSHITHHDMELCSAFTITMLEQSHITHHDMELCSAFTYLRDDTEV